MTTERRLPSRESRLKVRPLELRLYVGALLAVVYTISWRAIGGQVTEVAEVAPPVSEPQRFVWIDSLPSTSLPAIVLPVGWQRATSSPPTASLPTRLVRTPARRVRTRSS